VQSVGLVLPFPGTAVAVILSTFVQAVSPPMTRSPALAGTRRRWKNELCE
jgi:hypothetical protein